MQILCLYAIIFEPNQFWHIIMFSVTLIVIVHFCTQKIVVILKRAVPTTPTLTNKKVV